MAIRFATIPLPKADKATRPTAGGAAKASEPDTADKGASPDNQVNQAARQAHRAAAKPSDFDRKAYQRAYMAERRKAAKAKGGKAS